MYLRTAIKKPNVSVQANYITGNQLRNDRTVVSDSHSRTREINPSNEGAMGLNCYVIEIGLKVGLTPDISGNILISRGAQPHDWAIGNYNLAPSVDILYSIDMSALLSTGVPERLQWIIECYKTTVMNISSS